MKTSNQPPSKQSYAFTALIAACLLLLGTMVWIQGQTIESLQGQLNRVQAKQIAISLAATSSVLTNQITTSTQVSDQFFQLNQKSVKVRLGTFVVTSWCKGHEVDVSNFKLCVGTNRLTAYLQGSNGSKSEDFLLDERVGKASEFSSDYYDAPALIEVTPVQFDSRFYPSNYIPNDVLITYRSDPAFDGTEGVGSELYHPPTFLLKGKGFSGAKSLVSLTNYPAYHDLIYGPVGKGLWINEPVCSGAACEMDPDYIRMYNMYTDTSTSIGTQKAVFANDDRLYGSGLSGTDAGKTLSVWASYGWKDLTTVTASITEPNHTTNLIEIKVK